MGAPYIYDISLLRVKADSIAGPAMGLTHHFVRWVSNIFPGLSD